jgi:predicted nucleic acid-binding protein
MQPSEFEVDGIAVIQLAQESGCSAYNCEFVSLAQQLGVPLVTADCRLIANFPTVVISLETF